jgi:hypothetical protein
MGCQPTSEESLRELRAVAEAARRRGDECLAVLLAGIDLYVSVGREVELLEIMHEFEKDIRPAVEGTPSAAELERLYKRNPEDSQSSPG